MTIGLRVIWVSAAVLGSAAGACGGGSGSSADATGGTGSTSSTASASSTASGTTDGGTGSTTGATDGGSTASTTAGTGGETDTGGDLTGELLWAVTLPLAPYDLATTPDGNCYLAGWPMAGGADLGDGPLMDHALVKLDPDGQHVWSKDVPLTQAAVTSDGGVVALGDLSAPFDFGGGTIGTTDSNDRNIFVVRYDAGGTHQWSKAFVADAGNAYNITVDDDDQVFFTGTFYGSVDVDGTVLTSVESVTFLVSITAGGAVSFAQRLNPEETTAEGAAIIPDGQGGVILTGQLSGSSDFGGGPLAPSAGWYGAGYVVAYDGSGNHRYSLLVGNHASSGVVGQRPLALAPSGDVILAHDFDTTDQGPVDFGDGPVMSQSWDAFVMRLSADGARQWVRPFISPEFQNPWRAAVDPFGDILFGGVFAGSPDFGGGPLDTADPVLFQDHAFLVKLDADGNHRWSRSFAGQKTVDIYGLTTDAMGQIYVTGTFYPDIDFGDGPIDAGASSRAFVAKLAR